MDGDILMTTYYYQSAGAMGNKTINLPFAFTSTGGVATSDSYSTNAWKNKLLTVLLTGRGSRIWYDRMGASLFEAFTFENSMDVAAALKDAINEAAVRWVPEISISDVLYNYEPNTGALNITVRYQLPNGSEDQIALRKNSLTNYGDTLQVTWNG